MTLREQHQEPQMRGYRLMLGFLLFGLILSQILEVLMWIGLYGILVRIMGG